MPSNNGQQIDPKTAVCVLPYVLSRATRRHNLQRNNSYDKGASLSKKLGAHAIGRKKRNDKGGGVFRVFLAYRAGETAIADVKKFNSMLFNYNMATPSQLIDYLLVVPGDFAVVAVDDDGNVRCEWRLTKETNRQPLLNELRSLHRNVTKWKHTD